MAKVRLTLAQQIAQTQAKLQQLSAKEAEGRRKAENRQKIVLGGTVLAEMRDSETFKAQIVALLKQRVTRPIDREAVAQWLSTDSQQA